MYYKLSILNISSGKPELVKPIGYVKDVEYHYFVTIPRKDDIIDVGKICYQVICTRLQAYNKRKDIDPYHDTTTVIVKKLGRFDEVKFY